MRVGKGAGCALALPTLSTERVSHACTSYLQAADPHIALFAVLESSPSLAGRATPDSEVPTQCFYWASRRIHCCFVYPRRRRLYQVRASFLRLAFVCRCGLPVSAVSLPAMISLCPC